MITLALTLPTFIIILLALSKSDSRYVYIRELVYFCFFLFFVISPLQILHGLKISQGLVGDIIIYNDIDVIFAAMSCFLFVATFFICDQMFSFDTVISYRISPNNNVLNIMAILSYPLAVFYIILFGGLGNILSARYDQEDTGFGIVGPIIIGSISVFSYVIFSSYTSGNRKALFPFLLVMMPLALLINPFNSARFVLISTYAPLALISLKGKVEVFWFYTTSTIFLTIVMPILNITSRYGSFSKAAESGVDLDQTSLLRLQFIDVFDMLVYNAHFTSLNGFTYGEKFLGDFLFFIPRAIWASKPTLNGLDVGGQLLFLELTGTDNLSMPIFGDAYRDAGFLGIALCGAMVFISMKRIFFHNISSINGFPIAQYLLFGALPILFRGPFSAVVAYIFFQCLCLFGLRIWLGSSMSTPITWRGVVA